MHADYLATMVNEISAFFAAEDPEHAAESVATHLRRYWDPRMREQLIDYAEKDLGRLSVVSKAAVALLAAASYERRA